jgi:polymorphic toxin system DSP-PTPase phosphatase-like protein
MSGNVFQELKIRAQIDPVVRRKLAAHPLQFLTNFDLSFDEKRQIVLPHFSWIIDYQLAAMPFPSTEDAYVILQQLGIKVILNLTEYLDDVPLLSAFNVYNIPIASFKKWGHNPPTLQQMHQAVSIFQASFKSGQPVVVHCVHGLGRIATPTMVPLAVRIFWR